MRIYVFIQIRGNMKWYQDENIPLKPNSKTFNHVLLQFIWTAFLEFCMTYQNKSILNIKVVKIKILILHINHNFCPCTVNVMHWLGKECFIQTELFTVWVQYVSLTTRGGYRKGLQRRSTRRNDYKQYNHFFKCLGIYFMFSVLFFLFMQHIKVLHELFSGVLVCSVFSFILKTNNIYIYIYLSIFWSPGFIFHWKHCQTVTVRSRWRPEQHCQFSATFDEWWEIISPHKYSLRGPSEETTTFIYFLYD